MSEMLGLTFHPLTLEHWPDFERLFGPRGACAGCWCMWWKLSNKDMEALKGEGTRQAQKEIVESGSAPGLLAYAKDQAVGWCAVEPRHAYPRLARSRVLKPIDGAEVWSITCFFVDKKYRHQGVTIQLLRAAIDYVSARGGQVVEGYPTEPRESKVPAAFVYTGLASAFRRAGFEEVARRSETRPIFRYFIQT
jgi:GNAT superfamily N-acetyltransferase